MCQCLHCTFNPQGMLLAKDIRDRERGGRAEIRIIEGEAENESPQIMELLIQVLGQRCSALEEGAPDATADQEQKSKVTLYQWVCPPILMTTLLRLCCVLHVGLLFVLSCLSVCPMLKVKLRSRKSRPGHWARTSSTTMWVLPCCGLCWTLFIEFFNLPQFFCSEVRLQAAENKVIMEQ